MKYRAMTESGLILTVILFCLGVFLGGCTSREEKLLRLQTQRGEMIADLYDLLGEAKLATAVRDKIAQNASSTDSFDQEIAKAIADNVAGAVEMARQEMFFYCIDTVGAGRFTGCGGLEMQKFFRRKDVRIKAVKIHLLTIRIEKTERTMGRSSGHGLVGSIFQFLKGLEGSDR